MATWASCRQATAADRVGNVRLMDFFSRASQADAWKVGLQLQLAPFRDRHERECRISMPESESYACSA